MEWQIFIGSMSVIMAVALGIVLGIMIFREIILNKHVAGAGFWLMYTCLIVVLLGIISIVCVLINNVY